MLRAGQMQSFVTGDQTDNFGVAFHQFTLGKCERAGEADVEADGFQRVHAHQAQIQFFLQLTQIHDNRFAINGMGAFTEQVPVTGHLNKFVVVGGDTFGALLNLLIGHDIVKNDSRIVDDVTNNVGVGS